ncbi:MAG: hypothetical protein IBX62_02655, partial [Coriobacteriia bacterium]|nr:hypothetical protein [Coriobacteriia bacterium]
MAVAARRTPAEQPARPRLALVPPPRGSGARGAARAEEARWRSGFRTYVVVLAALAAVACGRLVLTTRAAEASLVSVAITDDIKAERIAGGDLEVSRSSLAAPSRIRDIAGESLQMVEPRRVDYLDLPA